METEPSDLGEREGPPEAFIRQVKQALEHLYDIEYLEKHPLPGVGAPAGESHPGLCGQRLRRELSAAIESLNPGTGTPFAAPPARIYNLLCLRYVERRQVQKAAQELGLSERQAHRDLRHGEKNVAATLWARRSLFIPEESGTIGLSSFEAEMARLPSRPLLTDIGEILKHAEEAVEPQAAERDIHLAIDVPQEPVTLLLDPIIAEQVLLNTLSYAVGQAYPATMHVKLDREAERATLTLRYYVDSDASGASTIDIVILQLADRLGWTARQTDEPQGPRTVTLHMAARGPTVLVIDDNEGLVELLERYLTDHSCRMLGARNGQAGLQAAQELIPDAIILDIMMPEMHGWEFLQTLRTYPHLAAVPVIICSVINNPRLAYCLGASLVLTKPVSQGDVLQALRQAGVLSPAV